MSDLDNEIRHALERVTGSVAGAGGPAFEQLAARRRRRTMHRVAFGVLPGLIFVVLAVAVLPFIVGGDDETRVTAGEIEPAGDVVDDVVDLGDITTGGGSTIGPGEKSVEPVADPGVLAGATGATTIVYGGPEEPFEAWDNHLLVWQGGTTTRIGPFSHPRIDNGFVIDRVSDSGPTRIHDLGGRVVCEPQLPDQANVHHVTIRADGTMVLGVERGVGEWPDHRTEAFAYDCQSGDRIPIEPFTIHGGDGEWVRIERIGGRIFEVHGDAEGNADPILNEDGVDIVGDDYAGQLAWSPDGSILAYGNHRNGVSPHVTDQLVVRDTRTGEFLWSGELPEAIARLDVLGDQLVVGFGEDRGGWVPTERIAIYDLHRGEKAGPVVVLDDPPPGLLYLD